MRSDHTEGGQQGLEQQRTPGAETLGLSSVLHSPPPFRWTHCDGSLGPSLSANSGYFSFLEAIPGTGLELGPFAMTAHGGFRGHGGAVLRPHPSSPQAGTFLLPRGVSSSLLL